MVETGNIVLDTSAVLAFLNGLQAATDGFNGAKVIYLPSIVVGELYYGLRKCNDPVSEEAKIECIIARTEVLTVDYETGKLYGSIMKQLETDGKRIPLNDIWIAALALQHEMPLLEQDKHFANVKGLKIISL